MAGNAKLVVVAAVIGAALQTPIAGAQTLPTCFGRTVTYPGTSENDSFGGILDQQNVMMGFAGEDEISGGDLRDFICGGQGSDMELDGRRGNDRLSGNSGNDTMIGGTGEDRIKGRTGDDEISARAGSDFVNGGAGTDTCQVDASDTVVNCEDVELLEASTP